MYFIQHGFRNGKKTSTRNVARIGKHSELLAITDDPLAYAKEQVAKYNEEWKNSKVTIYSARRAKIENEGRSDYFVVRKFRHPRGIKLWAYIRMIAVEQGAEQVEIGKERYLIVINRRDGVQMGDYVQCGDRLLKIVLPPDTFDLNGVEMKLTCEAVEMFQEPFMEE